LLKGALICAPIFGLLWFAEEKIADNLFFTLIFSISGIWTFIGIFAFLLSARDLQTFSKYLKDKKAYFFEMEKSIKTSKNYNEFLSIFY